ncbi:MAG: hypothetical protein PVF51_01640, partial [Nitrospirota bacterium]
MIRTTSQFVHRHAVASLLTTSLACAGAAHASDKKGDPLADLLVDKGVVSADEVAQLPDRSALPKGLTGMTFEALAYIDYSTGSSGEPGDGSDSFNRFTLGRGYLTAKKEILPWMRARTTLDVHQDDDEDWKVRLKYLYAELRPDDVGPLTQMKSEIGLGHMPWLDFEEHINPYRCQGTMAIERSGIFNSADLGVSLRGNIGGKLEDAKERTGNHHYDGQYGSWHVGVYNGGGYHAAEKNEDKVFEGRLTVRPLPDMAPGLQVSYLGITGDGNTDPGPDYTVNLGMVSYEHPWFILTGQYFQTSGNAKGTTFVDGSGDSLDTEGYSFFGNVKLPVADGRLAAFARWDHFDADADEEIAEDADHDLMLAGLAFDLHH